MVAKRGLQKSSLIISDSSLEKAIALRDHVVRSAKKGDAQICTYAWAYCYLFGESPPKWSQAHAKKVLALAENTPVTELSPPWAKSVLIRLSSVAERDCQAKGTGNVQLMIATIGNGFWEWQHCFAPS